MNSNKNFRKYSLGLLAGLLALLCLPQVNILGPVGLRGIADAGFFNNDLEVFEEVIDLVSGKYVYPPNHKKLFSAAIEEMIKNIDSEHVTLSKNRKVNTIRYKNQSTRYRLTYNKKHDWDELQKVYYFLHDQSDKAITKEDLEKSAI